MSTNSSIYIKRNATLYFQNNSAVIGGALCLLFGSTLHLEDHAVIYFSGNAAQVKRGAIYMWWESNIELHSNAEMYLIKKALLLVNLTSELLVKMRLLLCIRIAPLLLAELVIK